MWVMYFLVTNHLTVSEQNAVNTVTGKLQALEIVVCNRPRASAKIILERVAFVKRTCEYVALWKKKIKATVSFPKETCVLVRRNKMLKIVWCIRRLLTVAWFDICTFAPSRDIPLPPIGVLTLSGNQSPCSKLSAEHGCSCKAPSSLLRANVWKCRVESSQFSAHVFARNCLRVAGVLQDVANQTVDQRWCLFFLVYVNTITSMFWTLHQ